MPRNANWGNLKGRQSLAYPHRFPATPGQGVFESVILLGRSIALADAFGSGGYGYMDSVGPFGGKVDGVGIPFRYPARVPHHSGFLRGSSDHFQKKILKNLVGSVPSILKL